MIAVSKPPEKKMEAICIAILAVLFALSWLFVLGCEKLGEKS